MEVSKGGKFVTWWLLYTCLTFGRRKWRLFIVCTLLRRRKSIVGVVWGDAVVETWFANELSGNFEQ